ncbi:MAG TPA: 3-hydroxyacyl-CoA dehydrogenase NAD-binding domain-containing protein [Casimicrobiaceae bacterium]|jgi:3-hydroxyacyl-CoA dehydrogenase/enoyl-CoA hydratase/3-hydroxybutyryl-CoA epimerase|nr:3-hydroxyacyl-CoA dehydrogenase NAD-binding domain-containing protein [Casimicrobiaceae bacterium]
MSALLHWKLERDADGLGWLTFDKRGATTNTLSAAVLDELRTVLAELAADPPKGLVIRSGKENGFIAGADIDEFGELKSVDDAVALVKRGWNAFEQLAAASYPTLALIRGFCLGGGMELALACRYRVVVDEPGTRLGLPEVMLGIVPGWGGIKRLPRLTGAPAALDLLLTGRTVDARRARKLGIADECVPLRIMDNTARGVLRERPVPRRVPFPLSLTLNPLIRPMIAAKARKQVATRARREHYPAPYAILDIWVKYDGDALAVPPSDPASVPHLLQTPTAANLIRVFKLQERLKSFGRDKGEEGASARDVRRPPAHVHVVGAGTMGGDIAAWCALRGLTVTLQDQNAERLSPAIGRAAKLFSERLKDPLRVRDARDRLIPDVAGDGVAHADVVIEAIFENLEAKQQLFILLEAKAKSTALLATNTSSIPLEQIAAPMRDPGRLIGLHFFNPVARMMLVEIVIGAGTRQELIPTAAAFTRQIDKLPLPVKSAPGFLVNRILAPYLMEAMRCVDEGMTPETVDEAALAFGMPVGPIELADTVGLDICMAVGKMLGRDTAPPKRLSELIAAGYLGRKTKRGFYDWSGGKAAKSAPGIVPAGLSDRLIRPLVTEAKAALAEGIVADADLVDAGAIFGTGFAPFRGGPLHYAASNVAPRAGGGTERL